MLVSHLTSLIKKIDILSPSIGFEYNSSNKFKSYQGGFYSLIVLIITAYIGAVFSLDMINRNSPNVISLEEILPFSIVDLNTFPIVISISYSGVLDDKYLNYFSYDSFSFSISPSLTIKYNSYDTPVGKCNISSYMIDDPEKIELLNYTKNIGLFCLSTQKSPHIFQNAYTELNSTFIQLTFNKCTRPGLDGCPLNLQDYLKDIRIGISFIDSYVASTDYSKPIKYKITTHNIRLNPNINKVVFYQFKNDLFVSDNGWIFQNLSEINYLSFQIGLIDYYIPTSDSQELLSIVFESPTLHKITKRSFIKVQDLLSNVGGFLNIIIAILHLAVQNHLRFSYLFFLRDLILSQPSQVKNQTYLEPKNRLDANMNHNVKRIQLVELTRNSPQEIKDNSDKHIMKEFNGNLMERQFNNFVSNKPTLFNKHDHLRRIQTEYKIVNLEESYLLYVLSLFLCRSENRIKYDKQIAKIERVMNISVFTKIMAGNLTEESV